MKNEKHTGLKQYLSITEAAIFLGVSRPTIYSKLRSGELTYIQVSTRTMRIPLEALTSIQSTSCASADRRKLAKEDIKDYITREDALAEYSLEKSKFHKVTLEAFHSGRLKNLTLSTNKLYVVYTRAQRNIYFIPFSFLDKDKVNNRF